VSSSKNIARLDRQHKLGIVPAGTGLAPLNPGVTPWRDLAPDVRRLCARLQETYAAFLEHTDAQIGRLIEYLDSLGNLARIIHGGVDFLEVSGD